MHHGYLNARLISTLSPPCITAVCCLCFDVCFRHWPHVSVRICLLMSLSLYVCPYISAVCCLSPFDQHVTLSFGMPSMPLCHPLLALTCISTCTHVCISLSAAAKVHGQTKQGYAQGPKLDPEPCTLNGKTTQRRPTKKKAKRQTKKRNNADLVLTSMMVAAISNWSQLMYPR